MLQHHGRVLDLVKEGVRPPSSHLFRQLVWPWEFDGIAPPGLSPPVCPPRSVIFGIIIAQSNDCFSPLPRACLHSCRQQYVVSRAVGAHFTDLAGLVLLLGAASVPPLHVTASLLFV